MNGEYSARAIVAEELKSPAGHRLSWNVCLEVVTRKLTANTSFSVRIDYAVGEDYTKAVLYTFMPMNPRRDSTVPWGRNGKRIPSFSAIRFLPAIPG